MPFGDAEYAAYYARLCELADEKYRDFHSRLVPGIGAFLGCRVPDLRTVAKDILRHDRTAFLQYPCGETYEEKMVRGLVVAGGKVDFDTRLAELREFIPLIDNWAICDVVAGSLKDFEKNPQAGWAFLQEYLASDRTYEQRFALVMLLDYFVREETIDRVLEIYTAPRPNDDYYVKMAAAWGLSVCFVKFRDQTLELLQKGLPQDDFTYSKTISKICDSYRVSAEDKRLVKSLRR